MLRSVLQFFRGIISATWTGRWSPALKEPRDALPDAVTPTQKAVAACKSWSQLCLSRTRGTSDHVPPRSSVGPAIGPLGPNVTLYPRYPILQHTFRSVSPYLWRSLTVPLSAVCWWTSEELMRLSLVYGKGCVLWRASWGLRSNWPSEHLVF